MRRGCSRWICGALAVFGLLCFAPRSAEAFCRTTTKASAPDYDSSAEGCWDKGVPLFWRNACVGYSMHRPASREISYEDASNAISAAFTRWTGATCPTEGEGRSRTSIDVRDLGPVDCGNIEYISGVPNQNVIVFRDDSWKHGKQVLGLTTVVFNPDNGELYSADMEINTLDMEPLAIRDPVARDEYDFLSVVTHEAGHFLGMGHSDIPGATMFARYSEGQTSMRYLAPDDIEGICAVYRPDGVRSVLKSKITQAPQCDPTPRGGYSTDCKEKPGGCGAASTSPVPPRANAAWLLAIGGALMAVGRRRLRPRRAAG